MQGGRNPLSSPTSLLLPLNNTEEKAEAEWEESVDTGKCNRLWMHRYIIKYLECGSTEKVDLLKALIPLTPETV